MAELSFTQTFHHTDWVDDADRVRADEPNGFNLRFNAIEADLQQLSGVVAQIDAALNQDTGSVVRVLTVPPMLRPGWLIDATGAATVSSGTIVSGQLTVLPPNGVHLRSFRAIGRATGTSVSISLSLTPISQFAPQVLASVTGDSDPFDKEAQIDPAAATTATGTFRYFVATSVPATQSGAASIAAFQITYTAD